MIEPSNPPPNRFDDGSRFSDAERDWRWARTREMMRRQGLDALVVFHGYRDTYHRFAWWLSKAGVITPAAVVMPLNGELSYVGAHKVPGRWIQDTGPKGAPLQEGIVARLSDCGAKNVGMVGTEADVFGLNEFYGQGMACYSTVKFMKSELPDVAFTDVTPEFSEIMLFQSQESLDLCEEAALKGEELQKSVLEILEPGLTMRRLRSHIAQYTIMNDLVPDVEAIEMSPQGLKEGDVFNMENGLHYLGGYTQVTMSAAVGQISDELERMNEHATEVLAKAQARVKPGLRFADLVEPLTDRMKDAGYWHFFPLIHSLNPLALVGPIGREMGARYDATRGPDVLLQPNMLLSFEIAARQGPTDMVKIGGIGVVTENGIRMFNKFGTEMKRA